MNLIDLKVTELTSEPYQITGSYWNVDVMADGYGNIQPATISCKTKEEADTICVGYQFTG